MVARLVKSVLFWLVVLAAALSAQPTSVIHPDVAAAVSERTVDILVVLASQADLSPTRAIADRRTRARTVCSALQETAAHGQSALHTILDAAGVRYHSFWVVNAVAVRGADAALVTTLAASPDVARIEPDELRPLDDLLAECPTPADPIPARTVPWNVAQIGAPAVWATGNTGQDAVVGILDTGCDWTHPAVRDQYRGWDGQAADHDYNWHDAIHAGSSICGVDAPEPCDDLGHGTHVLGVVVGDDGQGQQIGVAPGARWIACRCIVGGFSSPSIFYEGFEWMLAPTPVGGGPGDPDLAPDVVTTAWTCTQAVGCTWGTLLPAVAALRDAGMVVVATGGGNGPGCGTILMPPQVYDESFTISATGPGDLISPFTGRGPVESDEQGLQIKPDLTAPGVNILSAVLDGEYATWSGSAMATGHAAGAVALVLTSLPGLAGDPDGIEARLKSTAVPLFSDQCGDGDNVPNNVFGHGRVDVAAACGVATAAASPRTGGLTLTSGPNPFNPSTWFTVTLDRPGPLDLRVYDLGGHLIRVLVSEPVACSGRHRVAWDGCNQAGRDLPTGMYLVQVRSGRSRASCRVLQVK